MIIKKSGTCIYNTKALVTGANRRYKKMQCKDNWLYKNCRGENVKTLQKLINATKLYTVAVDGWFYTQTETVLKKIQDLLWITVDGIAGDQTIGQLKIFPVGLQKIKNLIYDRQNNAYSCGDSALKMAASVYGLNLDENWLMQVAYTNSTNGTNISGLLNAINEVNKKYNTAFSPLNTGKMPLATLANYIKNGNPILARVESFLRPGVGEHWVTIQGINLNNQTIGLADPSYSGNYRIITLSDFKKRIQFVINKGHDKPLIVLK